MYFNIINIFLKPFSLISVSLKYSRYWKNSIIIICLKIYDVLKKKYNDVFVRSIIGTRIYNIWNKNK